MGSAGSENNTGRIRDFQIKFCPSLVTQFVGQVFNLPSNAFGRLKTCPTFTSSNRPIRRLIFDLSRL